MPEGFEKQVSRQALTDLLEFLTQRGGSMWPLPLEKVATAVSTRGMFNREEADPERLIFSDWSQKTFKGVPFVLVDPQGDRLRNVILLNSPSGPMASKMPRSVRMPVNMAARNIHLLSGVSGWGSPLGEAGSVSMIVRLTYVDGTTEEHPLKNGEHFADTSAGWMSRGASLRFRSGTSRSGTWLFSPRKLKKSGTLSSSRDRTGRPPW